MAPKVTAPTPAMPDATGVARAIRSYLDHLAVERGLAANTLASYRRDLRRYRAFLDLNGRVEVADITELDVADFLAALRQGDDMHPPLGATSAARTIVAVRGFHRFAVREGVVEADAAGVGETTGNESSVAEGDRGRRRRAAAERHWRRQQCRLVR